IASLKKAEEVVGSRVRASIVKNKVAAPFRKAEFDIMYDEGISKAANMLDFAEGRGIVKKVGTWYAYGEDKLGQGKENARLFLKENPKILGKIEKEVMAGIKE
ncbi:MAG: DNA recombination/repair protein RecA, partial [Candidatus Omnitrophota bacterium]